jgi:hypothetical protein
MGDKPHGTAPHYWLGDIGASSAENVDFAIIQPHLSFGF